MPKEENICRKATLPESWARGRSPSSRWRRRVIIAALAFWLTADSRAYSRGVEAARGRRVQRGHRRSGDHSRLQGRTRGASTPVPTPSPLAQMESGEYEAAQAAFAELGDYSDAAEQADECAYQLALAQMESGEYEAAQAAFARTGRLLQRRRAGRRMRLPACAHANGRAANTRRRRRRLPELGDYSNAAEQADECGLPARAHANGRAANTRRHRAAFAELGDYSNAAEQADECALPARPHRRSGGERRRRGFALCRPWRSQGQRRARAGHSGGADALRKRALSAFRRKATRWTPL